MKLSNVSRASSSSDVLVVSVMTRARSRLVDILAEPARQVLQHELTHRFQRVENTVAGHGRGRERRHAAEIQHVVQLGYGENAGKVALVVLDDERERTNVDVLLQ